MIFAISWWNDLQWPQINEICLPYHNLHSPLQFLILFLEYFVYWTLINRKIYFALFLHIVCVQNYKSKHNWRAELNHVIYVVTIIRSPNYTHSEICVRQQKQEDHYEFLDLSDVDDDERTRLSTALLQTQRSVNHRRRQLNYHQQEIHHRQHLLHGRLSTLKTSDSDVNEYREDDFEEIVTATAATADHLSVQCDYYIQSSPMFYVNRYRADHGLHGKLVLPYYMRT